MPYRVAAENDAARLEAEEFQRDLAAIRTKSASDWLRLGGAFVTLFAVLTILYGTFHRHADLARTDEVQDPRCRYAMEISPNGTASTKQFCGDFRDR